MGWFPAHGRLLLSVLGLMLPGLVPAARAAQAGDVAAAIRPMVLGHLSFPTSTTVPEAQEAFVSGVLLLHLFEYRLAPVEFRRAQQLDPSFVLATRAGHAEIAARALEQLRTNWREADPAARKKLATVVAELAGTTATASAER